MKKTINLANGIDRAAKYEKYINSFVSREIIENKHSVVIERRLKDSIDGLDQIKIKFQFNIIFLFM